MRVSSCISFFCAVTVKKKIPDRQLEGRREGLLWLTFWGLPLITKAKAQEQEAAFQLARKHRVNGE